MDLVADFLSRLVTQFQSPALAFLIGGMALAAFRSQLEIPDAIYKFAVFMLLMRIGIEGGLEIRDASFAEMLLPALVTIALGCLIVLLGRFTLAYLPGVKMEDAIATAGLFGAVSASTLAAAMVILEEEDIFYEAWVPALYPFMDIPALVLAIVLANLHLAKQDGASGNGPKIWSIIKDSLRGSALSALILGLALGLLTRPEQVFEGFYDPLFRGLLSILMLIMGMEAYQRLNELRKVAHWYAVYAFAAPLTHGLIAFGLGYLLHVTTGFSPGGVVLLSVLAGSSSDISGPPTLRAAIPTANPSSYIGSSTSIGTPVAIAIGIPLYLALAQMVF
ncbi:sodium-dependent bicarbonate transport family permease [Pontixanthobacter aestiaquae]|uniref:Sodium-dependent bicarbonate transport family permease n=1 Tax=Pontixanthobacter aestiaquae TaxID=1509367 RepID=A0A844ZA90_9SPHN|nr:sodium-dependent bicarbonate transport family permease [Pontixanthobacter aestiaquae]MDN3644771.1 sodium-dependent bicarbonate transport family permease [Pontixanthobacter aestiaquae]MXO84222.1 sodium-dependent bicarbonate transport family permease [Pontixanthobacter aestiaquae]